MSQQTEQQQPWTIARLLEWTQGHFARREVDEPRLAAEILLAHALGCKRIELYTRFDCVPEPPQLDQFRELVKRAAEQEPIAHLVGKKEFFSLEFNVTPDVLIPRPETELLVEKVIDYVRSLAPEGTGLSILELGTGSGCIAVALLAHLPGLTVVATDVSPEAIVVAEANAAKHGVADRIRFFQVDGLDLPAEAIPDDGFPLIVSNPPYIREVEMCGLDRNVRDYEPRGALTDGGDGLSFYRLLASERVSAVLASGGQVFVEVGDDQSQEVAGIFADSGRFNHKGTYSDTTGPFDRVLQFCAQT